MLCAATGGGFEENIETTGFDYFAEDELPELAGEKNNEEGADFHREGFRLLYYMLC